jgi:hypothetical protein
MFIIKSSKNPKGLRKRFDVFIIHVYQGHKFSNFQMFTRKCNWWTITFIIISSIYNPIQAPMVLFSYFAACPITD